MPKDKNSDFQDILSDLRKQNIHDLYVLCGEDIYLKNKIVESLGKLLTEPAAKDLDRVTFDLEGKPSEKSIRSIRDELSSPPFMSSRKLIIVRNSGLFTETKETGIGVSDVFSETNKNCCLVFIEEKIDRRKKSLIREISDKGILAEINKPEADELRIWTIREFARNGIGVSKRLADIFAERNDRDLMSMENEAVKLQLFLKSEGLVTLEEKHMEMIGASDLKGSVFNLTDLISSGDAGAALGLLDSLISRKEPVQLIFFMFARHIKQLICAKDIGNSSKSAGIMKIPPFVAVKLTEQASGMNIDVLEEMYIECARTDMRVKTSNLQDRTALEMLIAGFTERVRSDKLNK